MKNNKLYGIMTTKFSDYFESQMQTKLYKSEAEAHEIANEMFNKWLEDNPDEANCYEIECVDLIVLDMNSNVNLFEAQIIEFEVEE